MGLDDYEQVEVLNRGELREWLRANHDRDRGVFLVVHKKHTDHWLPWGEIVPELLAWGWVDATTRAVDEDRTSLLISPRRQGSGWSRINKEHVEALEASGEMTDHGRAVIARSKQDGSWALLDDVEAGIVPDDLAAALAERDARDQWDDLPWSTQRATLAWVTLAKRADTRERRVTKAADVTASGGRPR